MKVLEKNMFKLRLQSGFTLVEFLVAAALMGVLSTVIMNFLHGYNRTGNENSIKFELENKLRNAMTRIEKEILQASRVRKSKSLGISPNPTISYTTGINSVILEIPLYNSSGFVVIDNATGAPLVDTLAIYKTLDNEADKFVQRGGVQPYKLGFHFEPNGAGTRSQEIKNAFINQLLPNRTSATTTLAQEFYPWANPADTTETVNTGYPGYGVFRYYQIDSTTQELAEITSTVQGGNQTDCDNVGLIKINLWTEKEYGSDQIRAKREFDVKLRNYSG